MPPAGLTADHSVTLPEGLDTPCLVVNLERLEANLAGMAALLAGRGVALRPHTKTHRCTAIARRQLEAGAAGLTVASLGEAEVFADSGADDLFVAYPLWAAGPKAARLRALHERVRLRVGLDSAAAAAVLAAAVAGSGRPLEVLVEVDAGLRRTGVAPAAAGAVAAAAGRAGLAVVGAFTHGGHAYGGPERVAAAAADERRALERAAEALARAGFDAAVLSAGSTPTAALSAAGAVTEERPGTYVFGDRQQVALGACRPGQVALVVAATVVSAALPGQVVLDAGSKALALDRPAWLAGHGELPAWPGLTLTRLTEEHGVAEVAAGAARPQPGEVVAVVPNHACPVVNLFDQLLLARGGRLVGAWPVDSRGRSA
jgi:D-serine deaminase-like pyridoxal phosphate-dependent protein